MTVPNASTKLEAFQPALVKDTCHKSLPRRCLTNEGVRVACVTSVLVAGYLLFVVHYSTNFIFWDEWSAIPITDSALHAHLTLSLLWSSARREPDAHS